MKGSKQRVSRSVATNYKRSCTDRAAPPCRTLLPTHISCAVVLMLAKFLPTVLGRPLNTDRIRPHRSQPGKDSGSPIGFLGGDVVCLLWLRWRETGCRRAGMCRRLSQWKQTSHARHDEDHYYLHLANASSKSLISHFHILTTLSISVSKPISSQAPSRGLSRIVFSLLMLLIPDKFPSTFNHNIGASRRLRRLKQI